MAGYDIRRPEVLLPEVITTCCYKRFAEQKPCSIVMETSVYLLKPLLRNTGTLLTFDSIYVVYTTSYFRLGARMSASELL